MVQRKQSRTGTSRSCGGIFLLGVSDGVDDVQRGGGAGAMVGFTQRHCSSATMKSTARFSAARCSWRPGFFNGTKLKNACLTHLPVAVEFSDGRLARGETRRIHHGPGTRRYIARAAAGILMALLLSRRDELWWIAIITVLVLVEKMGCRADYCSENSRAFFSACGESG